MATRKTKPKSRMTALEKARAERDEADQRRRELEDQLARTQHALAAAQDTASHNYSVKEARTSEYRAFTKAMEAVGHRLAEIWSAAADEARCSRCSAFLPVLLEDLDADLTEQIAQWRLRDEPADNSAKYDEEEIPF